MYYDFYFTLYYMKFMSCDLWNLC